MINLFYESGYNGEPWSFSADPATDIFYFDLHALKMSDDLLGSIHLAAENIFKAQPLILDDQSLEAKIIKELLPSSLTQNIVPWPKEFPIDYKASEVWHKEMKLSDPELHLILQYAKYTQSPILVPRAWLRIINASWSYTYNKSIGPAFWNYIENERHHIFQSIAKAEGLSIYSNIFKWSDQVYSAYFNHLSLQNFLLSEQANHSDNYNLERQMLLSIYDSLGKNAPQVKQVDKVHWDCPTRLVRSLNPFPMQQASFPLHTFYRHYLNTNLEVNLLEQHIYGVVL